MYLNCGFEPLFDRLIYIRQLAFVRPAIPEYVDPLLCLYSFYYTLDRNGQVVYATDQKPDYRPKVIGKFSMHGTILYFVRVLWFFKPI